MKKIEQALYEKEISSLQKQNAKLLARCQRAEKYSKEFQELCQQNRKLAEEYKKRIQKLKELEKELEAYAASLAS